jgi:hypothetical protein
MATKNEKNGASNEAKNSSSNNANIEALKAKYERAKLAFESAKKALYEAQGQAKKEPKGPGVIETIFEAIKKSGEKGISKKALLAKLEAKFPERATEGMSKTIAVQLPKRMSRERKVKIEKLANGNFALKAPKAKAPKAPKKEEVTA